MFSSFGAFANEDMFRKGTCSSYLMKACFPSELLSPGVKMKEKINYNNIGRDPHRYYRIDHLSSVLAHIQAHHCQDKRCISPKRDRSEGGNAGDIFNK